MSMDYTKYITEFVPDITESSDSKRPGLQADLKPSDIESSTNSTNSTGGHPPEKAIYPSGSVIEWMMNYGTNQSEAADCYLAGAFMAMVAACVGRRVYFPWGNSKWYPNLYVMLVGRPGDRKTDAISHATRLIKGVIPNERRLPGNFSKEAMFDEYDEECGGCPDKVMIVPEGNIVMDNWKSGYGEQVASQFLALYDCEPLSESFKRNKRDDSQAVGRRVIEETSTTVLIGTTFGACKFPSKTIQSGMHRRFLFFLANRTGRTIHFPPSADPKELLKIREALERLNKLEATKCRLTGGAKQRWITYQDSNRAALANAVIEQERSRLNSSPNHVMKVAMLFSASRWCTKSYSIWDGEIDEEMMDLAIEFVDHAARSAAHLDIAANREQSVERGELILAQIGEKFSDRINCGVVRLSRSELTAKFCHHSGRPGALSTTELYGRIIPYLEKIGVARIVGVSGKKSIYEFEIED
ncbi:YfjI family protein [Verrucomicrobia bacterium]|nr:YfjI family protein [Verrucomicrobiota bacterium]